jgi:DNA-binding transcriptional ArsR family regulator
MDNRAYQRLAEVVKTLGHPVRLRIIESLLEDEKSVNAICGILDLPQPQVSQHLALLRNRGIVQDQRCGAHVKYCIKSRMIEEMVRLMQGVKLT